jgi:hypothetical protein
VQTGWIVWVNGPFPCGTWPDLRIARESLIYALQRGEYYIADGGYHDGNQWSVTPNGLHTFDQRQMAHVRARHETINRRFKQFSILRNQYRFSRDKHGMVFMAVANVIQLGIVNREVIVFDVDYDEHAFWE